MRNHKLAVCPWGRVRNRLLWTISFRWLVYWGNDQPSQRSRGVHFTAEAEKLNRATSPRAM